MVISDKFLQKYPHIAEFLELYKSNTKRARELLSIKWEETNLIGLDHMKKHEKEFIFYPLRVNGKDYLEYALELHKDFEEEKRKNGIFN